MANEINTFCEKPGHVCTFGYCDENGCQERKRNYTALGISHLEDDELLKHLSINLSNPDQADLVMTELMTRLGNRSRPAPATTSVSGGAAPLTDAELAELVDMCRAIPPIPGSTFYAKACNGLPGLLARLAKAEAALAASPASVTSPQNQQVSELLAELSEADKQLEVNGYKSWCYTRLAISKARAVLASVTSPVEPAASAAGIGVKAGLDANKVADWLLDHGRILFDDVHDGEDAKKVAAFAFAETLIESCATPSVEASGGGPIAVSERLPEKSGFYLVFGNCTGQEEAAWDIAGFHVEVPMFAKYQQPTHWMPLPNQPAA